jgi:two-component system, response regulator PdtaR
MGVADEAGGDSAPVILIVEDEFLIRMHVVEVLENCGFAVAGAASADDAIHYLEEGGAADLIFTDVRMPGSMDGFGLSGWLATNRPGVPVFIASGDIGMTNMARKLCAHERFFCKPYDIGAIAPLMREAIGCGRKLSGASS